MTKSNWLPVSLLVLAAAIFTHNPSRTYPQAQEQNQDPPFAWEYKIVRATEDILNQQAADGWEVVTSLSEIKGQSAGMRAINTIERVIMRRPRQN